MRGEKGKIGGVGLEEEEEVVGIGEGGLRTLILSRDGLVGSCWNGWWDLFFLAFARGEGMRGGGNDDIYIQ